LLGVRDWLARAPGWEEPMGSIIDSFASLLTPQVADRIGTTTGVSPNLVAKGLAVIGPIVAGLAAKSAVAPGGLRTVMNLMPSGLDAHASGIDDVLRASRDGHASSGLMNALFGAGQGSITRSLTRALGFDATSLLRIGTMLMLGVISRNMRDSRLDDASTARLLQEEQRTFLTRNDDLSRLVKDAVAAGEEANQLRQRYTPHEWASARLAPIAAAQVVMMASPSGLIGITGELSKATEEIQRARGTAVPASLVGVLFDGEISREEVQSLKDRQVALGIVKEGIAAVKANTPSEAQNFGHLLVDVAVKTAAASKEGGFLGYGGKRVTRDEQDAIDAIKSAAEVR
jgi:hypothetical protein